MSNLDAPWKASLTVEHDRADAEVSLHYLADVTRLFLKLSHCAHLGCLVGIDEASWYFYHGRINGWTPLLLQKNPWGVVWLGRILQDC